MEEKEVNKEAVEEKVESTESKLSKKEEKLIKKTQDDLEKALYDSEHRKNEYYKAYADMANLRKEIERDHKEAVKYRLEGFVENILGVLDAFDMAFRVEPTNTETKNYLIGFEYVYKQLLSILEGEGIQELSPKINDKFDEKTMQAVDTVEDEGEENLVKEITLRGYKLHDHLVRPAMVIVSKHPSSKDVKENDEKIESEAQEA